MTYGELKQKVSTNGTVTVTSNGNTVTNDNDKIKNPIFDTIKNYYLCYDDAIILNLNLIINSCIQYPDNEILFQKEAVEESCQ